MCLFVRILLEPPVLPLSSYRCFQRRHRQPRDLNLVMAYHRLKAFSHVMRRPTSPRRNDFSRSIRSDQLLWSSGSRGYRSGKSMCYRA